MTLPPASLCIKGTQWRRSLTWNKSKLNWCLVLNLSRCKLGTAGNWCLTGQIMQMNIFSGAPPHLLPGTLKRKTKIADRSTLRCESFPQIFAFKWTKASNWRTCLRQRSLCIQTLGLYRAFQRPRTILDKNDWVPPFWGAQLKPV